MSDELECFRKAAELGCPDFYNSGKDMMFRGTTQYAYLLPCVTEGNFTDKKINRYAAAVCACWWRENGVRFTHPHMPLIMSEQARAFGKKYGGA